MTSTKMAEELAVLKGIAKRIPQAQQVKFTEITEGYGYISVYFGFGSGNITVGFERFKGRKTSYMFMHCIIPKKKLDVENALTCMEIVYNRHQKIEIYYGEDVLKDYNGSRTYHPETHVIVEKHLTKLTKENKLKPLQPIEHVLAEFAGTEKTHHKKIYKRQDYDQIYQNL